MGKMNFTYRSITHDLKSRACVKAGADRESQTQV